jgi:hypothetical protein
MGTNYPIDPTKAKAGCTFMEAVHYAIDHAMHIGFMLDADDPFVIIDLDNKPERPASPEVLAQFEEMKLAFDSYTEISRSGRGIHIIVTGQIPQALVSTHIQISGKEHYYILTGDCEIEKPIRDGQAHLDAIIKAVGAPPPAYESKEQSIEDEEVWSRATQAENAEKFLALWNNTVDKADYGNDESTVDFALITMLCFHSQCDEQVARFFLNSPRGKRNHRVGRTLHNYIYKHSIPKARKFYYVPPIDFQAIEQKTKEVMEKMKQEPIAKDEDLTFPAGLVGEVAEYIYSSSIRPTKAAAIVGALGLVAGISARAFNISGTGLNLYLVLLAGSGTGKEAMASSIDKLFAHVYNKCPSAIMFRGPSQLGSGQGLIKVLEDNPCVLSLFGEFGLTLQAICHPRANPVDLIKRQVLLDAWSKSGPDQYLHPMAYSDKTKNTKTIRSPCFTMIGDSTPDSFFEGLDASHIASGLLPRFSIVEYRGAKRPAKNPRFGHPPTEGLVQKLADLTAAAVTALTSNLSTPVTYSQEALEALNSFDRYVDLVINESSQETVIQLWNRGHLKALKIAAVIAVGLNPYNPVIDGHTAVWAIRFVEEEITTLAGRFADGQVGYGDDKQTSDLMRAIKNYLHSPSKTARERFKILQKKGIIPYAYLLQATASLASYRQDRLGATAALKRALDSAVATGELIEFSKSDMIKNHSFGGVAYALGTNFV